MHEHISNLLGPYMETIPRNVQADQLTWSFTHCLRLHSGLALLQKLHFFDGFV